MIWQIKPFSHRCCISDEPFEPGVRYASYLVVGPENEMQRFDVLAEREEDFSPEGEVICKWRQVYKKEPEKDGSRRRQKETAEGLFFSLFDEPEGEGDGDREETVVDSAEDDDAASIEEEREAMKKFLALFLERRRILKNRGATPDRNFKIMEHMKSHSIFMVPAGDLEPEEVLRIGERLEELVG